MDLTSDSSGSENDDDIYVGSAARLKALKKKAPLLVVEHNSAEVNKKNDNIPNFWSSGTSASQEKINSHRMSERREKSPDVVITSLPKDDDLFERSVDSMNCTVTSVDGIEDDNYNIDVKVRWKSREIVRLELRKYESFEKVFKHFAEMEGVSEKQILILRGNRRIDKSDTPASMDLRVIDILEGGIVNADVVCREEEKNTDEKRCKIKVQMSTTKQKIVVELKMEETFKTVVLTCAEQLNVAASRIKLAFDGEDIAPTDTPETLDLEQEACIDLRILKA